MRNDLERFKFNTAIAALMELTNLMAPMYANKEISQPVWFESVTKLLTMLAPIAPHISEELWEIIGLEYSIHNQPMPEWDESIAAVEEATMVVQVNGKLRDRIQVSAEIGDKDAKEIALNSERVAVYTQGKKLEKVVYVPTRYLVSIVVKE